MTVLSSLRETHEMSTCRWTHRPRVEGVPSFVSTARRRRAALRQDATGFLFCYEATVPPVLVAARKMPSAASKGAAAEEERSESESDDQADGALEARRRVRRGGEGCGISIHASCPPRVAFTSDALGLPPLEPAHMALLLPALAACHFGPGAVVQSCLPLVVPFSMPELSYSTWASNKKALAYNRCVIVTIYIQGACALLKFTSGNMVGGFFDGMQVAMGIYSLTPDGMRLLPTYMMMSGVNGAVGLLQVLQTYNGIPLAWLPKLQIIPPVMAMVSSYFSWQFLKECRTISAGVGGVGRQPATDTQGDSCIVWAMGADWWPSFIWAPIHGEPRSSGQDRGREGGGITGFGDSAGGGFGAGLRFPVFEGSGHRLGEQ